jgi:hypothetical protein
MAPGAIQAAEEITGAVAVEETTGAAAGITGAVTTTTGTITVILKSGINHM